MPLTKRLLIVLCFCLSSLSSQAVIDSISVTPSLHSGCYDACKGTALIKIYPGFLTGPPSLYGVIWRGNSLPGQVVVDTVLATDTLFNLCAGDYSVEVIDLSDFSAFGPVFFSIAPAPPIFVNYSIMPPTCHDSINGSITAAVSGGTPAYQYQWSSSLADINPTVGGLGGGIYSLTVTDDSGCVYTDSVFVPVPDTLKANLLKTDVTCKGKCDGKIFSFPSGGTPGYHFAWDNSDTNSALNSLCPDTFKVTITDGKGCTVIDSVIITEADSLKVTYAIDAAMCNGDCNGQITASPEGGKRPYTYYWSGYALTDSILTNACPGAITATIADSSGCFVTQQLIVPQPAPIQPNDTTIMSSCGMCNGEIKLFPTGGTGPYSFLWVGQKAEDTLSSIDSLCAGIYQVVITDSLLCTDTFTVNLSDTSSIVDIGFISLSASCVNVCNGALTAYPIGGTAPFIYLWMPGGSTDSSITGLCHGAYTVQITDSLGCKKLETYELSVLSDIATKATITDVSCVGSCDGSAAIKLTGGQAPYHISWPSIPATGSSVVGLCAGKQSFVVTDANGCLLNDTIMINQSDTLKVQVQSYATRCNNTCTGAAKVMITGGLAPFQVDWSTGAFGDSIGNFCPGSYTVNVTDARGCMKTAAFVIGTSSIVTSNATIYHSACNVNDGSIKLHPAGGIGPYKFKWFNNAISDSIYGLGVGIHYVSITDSLGCTFQDSFLISNPSGPQLDIQKTHESCQTKCDGSIIVTPVNATGPFTYAWNAPYQSVATNNLSGLCAGTYYVEVTAGNGCKSLKAVEILSGGNMQIDFTMQKPSCNNGCNGFIQANVTGGLPPYQYNWSVGSSANTITNLCAGNYPLTITDAKGCVISKTATLSAPQPISVSLSTSNLLCHNICDGHISSAISGGTAPYKYIWSTGNTGSTEDNLCEGTYWLTVTDANGCSGTDTISIGNGVPISGAISVINSGCTKSNGSATINASGGNGLPYSYQWSTGDTLNTAGNLSAGTYTVSVFDNAGCSADFMIAVSDTGGPQLNDTSIAASCFGYCDGMGIINVISGSASYIFTWNDPLQQSNDTAQNLCAGIYSYMVRDTMNCASFDSIVVTEPTAISSAFVINPISCPGDDDASITVTPGGGLPPYKFLWSNADTISTADSLAQGAHWVRITDSSGCFVHDTVTLSDPTLMSLTLTPTGTSCFGSCDGSILAAVSGGSGPFTFAWNDPASQVSQLAIGLCAGYTIVTVTDARGCTATDSALITSPTALSATPVLNNPTCNNGTNGSISLSPVGGTSPFNYSWNNGKTGANITGLAAGSYTVTIVDAKQCVFQSTYILNNPPALGLNVNITQPTCGMPDGILTALASGGSGSYGFTWNTVPTLFTSTIDTLWPDTYTVTVKDNNTGCTASKSVILNNVGGPALSMTTTNETCPQACNGSATVHAGAGTFAYAWNDATLQTDSTASNLCSGTYKVKVINLITGCISFDTVTILPDSFTTIISNIKDLACFGDCNGSATVTASMGLPPYTYSWNTLPVQMGQTANNLCAGIYTATATDSANCIAGSTFAMHQPEAISIIATKLSDIGCAGVCNGRASIAVSGGTPPYNILWNGINGSAVNIGLCAGLQTIEVIDAKGCSNVTTVNILNALPIQANEIFAFPTCGSYDGAITLEPTGGQGPYFYEWSTGAKTSEITGLFAGIYSVNIKDINGCSADFTFFLNNPNAPVLQFDKDFVDCFGDCNGVARVTPLGGVAPYTYLWNNVPPSITDSLTSLCSGIYFVKVTDATACIAFGADTIGEPALLAGNLIKITDGCGGECAGEAQLTPVGGTAPYNFQWNSTPPQSGGSATGLCAGFVTVVLTDTNSCQFIDSIEIIPPPVLVIDSTIHIDATCFTNADGEATVFASGGAGPYEFEWSNTDTTQTIVGLNNGIYTVIVTDANNCTAFDTVLIAVNDTVLVNAFVDTFVCIGSEVLLYATSKGASIFEWYSDSLGTLTPIATGDSVYYTVTDSVTILLRGQNNLVPPCFDLDTSYVIGIPPPVIDAGLNVTIEKGKIVQLFVNPPSLINGSFAWTPSESLNDTTSSSPSARPGKTTTYRVIGTDEYGCVGSDTVTVTVIEDKKIFNGFSPNGDGVNDNWELPFLVDYPSAIVEVYNRWGLQVFRSDGNYTPWDGRYEGQLLPAASYYYVIDYFGNGEKVDSGALTILY